MATRPSTALRPFRRPDAPRFAELASDPRVTRFVGDGQPWGRQYTEGRIDEALRDIPVDRVGACRWFVATTDGVRVGIVVSLRRDAGIDIGYWLRPERWGQGLGGAMVDAALLTVPDVYGTGDLLARVDPANIASGRLLTGRGFQFDGHHEGVDHYRLP